MCPFPTEVCNTSSKAYWIISPVFAERFPTMDSKTIQKVHKLLKNKNEKFRLLWTVSEVFWSKTLQRSLQKCDA